MKNKGITIQKGKLIRGMGLIETIITIGIFAVVGILVTRATFLSLQGSRKGGSTIKVRENLDYAVSVIERQLRNATSITDCGATKLTYEDNLGEITYFECVGLAGDDGYLASGSARLTTPDAVVTACAFSCSSGSSSAPPQVEVIISSGGIDLTTKIDLRTY